MCCIWAIGGQCNHCHHPSHAPRIRLRSFKSIFPDSTREKCWIGSWNFYPHCIRCTCLNSFYWAAKLAKSGKIETEAFGKQPWTCCRRHCSGQNVFVLIANCLTTVFVKICLQSREVCDLEHGAGEGMLQWLKCVRYLTNICSSPQTILIV